MTPDPRRQAIEAAKQAHFLRIAKGPTQAMEAAIDAYEAAMRPVGTLYHPPAHQVQLLDRGAVHWSTFPTSPQDPEAGHDPSVG